MKQYLKLNKSSSVLQHPAGISDRTVVLKALILFAQKNSMELILPEFLLSGIHQTNNKGHIRSYLSEYYDFSKVLAHHELITLCFDPQPTDGLIVLIDLPHRPSHHVQDYHFYENQLAVGGGWNSVLIPYTQEIKDLTKKFRYQLPKELCTVKWRRGDKLTEDPTHLNGEKFSRKDYNGITSPSNLIKTFDKLYAFKDIYLLTNAQKDKDPAIEQLQNNEKYKFHFAFENDEMMEIQKQDNYKLFCIERQMETINCPDCWPIEFEELRDCYYDK